MTATLIKRHMALTALFALMFLRFVDLAVFDMDHDHVVTPHVKVHASEMAHGHDLDEPTEHDTLDGKSAHVGFHTLLNVFTDVEAVEVPVMAHFTARFGFHANEDARAHAHRPPVPPPLA